MWTEFKVLSIKYLQTIYQSRQAELCVNPKRAIKNQAKASSSKVMVLLNHVVILTPYRAVGMALKQGRLKAKID